MSIEHRLATPVILPRMYFFDADGKPLVGGKIYSYKVGTDEFKPTYRNSELTALNTNPVVLDGAGSALIYLRGANLLKIYDRHGNFIEERIEYQQRERAQFYDDYGKPLRNGFIYTYDYQSTLKKNSFKHNDVLNTNPIVLDENGTALVNIVGAYRLRQYNSKNVFVGDQDFKRAPIKALTSVVYPLYLEEGLTTNLNVLNLRTSRSPNPEENLVTNFNVLNVLRAETVRYGNLELKDDLGTNFNTLNPIRVETVRYGKTSNPENLSTLFNVLAPKRVKVTDYIKTSVSEDLQTNFNVSNPKRVG